MLCRKPLTDIGNCFLSPCIKESSKYLLILQGNPVKVVKFWAFRPCLAPRFNMGVDAFWENCYQCHSIEFSYLKHIVCFAFPATRAHYPLFFCLMFPNWAWFAAFILFPLCTDTCAILLSSTLKVPKTLLENSLESFIKIKISNKLCHWKTGSYTCLLAVGGICRSPPRHIILACICVFST